MTLCIAAKRKPWNLKIFNFFLYFKIIFFLIYIDIVSGCEARARKFKNFNFFSLLQNIFLKNIYIDIVSVCEVKHIKFLKILNFFLYFKLIFLKNICIDIVSGCEVRPKKFENFKFFYLLQINILLIFLYYFLKYYRTHQRWVLPLTGPNAFNFFFFSLVQSFPLQ